MNNLSSFGVQELNNNELLSIEGGSRWKGIAKLLKESYIGWAVGEFMDGFSSCSCER